MGRDLVPAFCQQHAVVSGTSRPRPCSLTFLERALAASPVRENKPCAGKAGLFDCQHLQLERTRFAFVAKSALAGLLALLLLGSSALALSSAHRRSHDFGRATPSHQCAFCLFTHGQITLSDVSPPSTRVSAVVVGIVAPFHSA